MRAGRQFVWSVCCFVVALLAASVLVAPSGAAGTDEAGGQAAEPDLAGTGQAAGQVAEPDSAKADEIGEAGGAVEPVVPVASVVRVGGSGVAEGGSREFRVGLSAAAAEVVKVSYSVVAGSSTASVSDYVLSPAGSVTFAAGEVSKTVTLVAVDDAIDEPGEVVTLGLLAGSGYAVSSVGGSAEVKILDNDAAPVASISSGGSAVEGDEVVLTVSLSAASGYGLSVALWCGGGFVDGFVVGLCLVAGGVRWCSLRGRLPRPSRWLRWMMTQTSRTSKSRCGWAQVPTMR